MFSKHLRDEHRAALTPLATRSSRGTPSSSNQKGWGSWARCWLDEGSSPCWGQEIDVLPVFRGPRPHADLGLDDFSSDEGTFIYQLGCFAKEDLDRLLGETEAEVRDTPSQVEGGVVAKKILEEELPHPMKDDAAGPLKVS
ncbi:UNVERIFIED_CONTAM: hypothetical protein Sradi_3597900 [Sesamum radiatum]|uniref:Uncharacterized protein n=1 Tax=Sesamum radiatum TaxID=300843 RepID=A0AAW2QGY6_SESRA